MTKIFKRMIDDSRKLGASELAMNFGNIPNDIAEMLENEKTASVFRLARENMSKAGALPGGLPRLQKLNFGDLENAPELISGKVAAVDGRPVLPAQRYSLGQALCVGVGSVSHTRQLLDDVHFWSTKVYLDEVSSIDEHLKIVADGNFGINPTAYLRYFEVLHGVESVKEDFIFFDGAVVYEWLLNTSQGQKLYVRLFGSGKKCIGVMKNINASPRLAVYAKALETGEVYVVETLRDHLQFGKSPPHSGEVAELENKILRGVFKPAKKPFGFECHIDCLNDMLRIMAADCQMNNVGHEIPYLLNRVDEEVRRNFNQKVLAQGVASQLSQHSEELFMEEESERNLR